MAAAGADPALMQALKMQLQLEDAFGLPAKPAFPGDSGAEKRAHAVWRAANAHRQHDSVGGEVEKALNEAADVLPMDRNFLENLVEFLRGGWENVTGVIDAAMDPGATFAAFAGTTVQLFTNPGNVLSGLVDVDGMQRNEWRWAGSLLLGGGIGKAGKVAKFAKLDRDAYLPHGVKPGYFTKYQDGGFDALPGKTGGDAVISVQGGGDLPVTPELREKGSYLNPYRMDHIIERHSIDAPYPDPETTQYPADWDDAKIFEAVQHVASDPNSVWTRKNGEPGSLMYTHPARGELPVRFTVNGQYEGFNIRVGVEPFGEGIVTGFMPNGTN